MSWENGKGKVNSNTYDDGKTVINEYTETGKLDFDFLLGRHILHTNNLMSQDILGDTISGNNLGVQKCEVALDILSNMLEIYTNGISIIEITELVIPNEEMKFLPKDLDMCTYYDIYRELRHEKFKRFCKHKDLKNISTGQKELDKLNFRFTQLSNIHRYLILWINECGLTPTTTSMDVEMH